MTSMPIGPVQLHAARSGPFSQILSHVTLLVEGNTDYVALLAEGNKDHVIQYNMKYNGLLEAKMILTYAA